MKHTKHELMLYSFYDFTGLASHLETMAAKGWLAEKNRGFWESATAASSPRPCAFR